MKTLKVMFKNEDELPEMTAQQFNQLYKESVIDVVRVYPYVVINGEEYYLIESWEYK